VLSYALARPGYVAVIDDAAGRRCATSLNITVIVTVGLIALAKRRGLIARIAPGLTYSNPAKKSLKMAMRLVAKWGHCNRSSKVYLRNQPNRV
jgi:predicted nucleic acid-binding protein